MNLLKRICKKIIRIFGIDKLVYKVKLSLANETIYISENGALEQLKKIHDMPNTSPITNNIITSKKYDLTIIIPAYNAEKWIKECLESVVNQKTKYNYKVVIINDGSTDNTLEIINEYSQYHHFFIINQENKGYSGARNIALKQIESQYIMFLDSDDLLGDNAISLLLDTAYQHQSDIVEGSAIAFNEDKVVYQISRNDCVDSQEPLWGAPWLKVIKSELFEHIEFPLNYLYEDTIISFLVAPQAKKVSTISNIVYKYRIHSQSITQLHTDNPNRIDSFWIMLLVHESMPYYNLNINQYYFDLTMRHIVMTYRRTILLDKEIKQSIFTLTKKFLIGTYSQYLNTNKHYLPLIQSIMNNEYKRYCLICENIKI